MLVKVIPLAVPLLLMLLTGCHVTRQEVPGHYYERFGWGEVTLDLRENGTFVEEATLKDGTKRRIEGKWTFAVRNHQSRVERGPCLALGSDGLEKEPFGGCGESVRSILGTIEIPLDPDHGYAYVKEGPAKPN
jgi:hypothetical protein